MTDAESVSFAEKALRCLTLTVEFETDETTQHVHHCDQADHDAAAAVVSRTIDLVKEGDLKVVRVDEESTLDFDDVNSREVPAEWFSVPMLIQFFYDKTKVFARVLTHLTEYDGVAALHTLFNVMEQLEHINCDQAPESYLTKPAFKTSNLEHVFDPAKLDAHIEFLEKSAASVVDDGTKLPACPSRADLEDSLQPRIWKRFASKDVKFKQFTQFVSDCQARLDLPYIAYTVNYAPSATLGRTTNILDTLDKQKRVDGIFVPKGPIMPMNLEHVRQLSYALFWNNYGRHNPNISSKVKSVVWDWAGFLKSFAGFAFAIEVHGQPFYVTSFPERDWKVCAEAFGQVDGGVPLRDCPMPKIPEVQVPHVA